MITIEQIDEFRKRTNSSYSDAKYFLEKNNGNILDAIIDFERTKAGSASNQNNRQHNDMGERFADFLQKGFDTRVIVEDKETVLFSVPVILLIILIPLWLVVVLFFAFLQSWDISSEFRRSVPMVLMCILLKNINAKMKEQSSFKQQKPNNNTASDNTQENKNTGNFNTAETSANDSSGQKFDDDDDDDYNEFIVE